MKVLADLFDAFIVGCVLIAAAAFFVRPQINSKLAVVAVKHIKTAVIKG